jgi:hypothetical protein
MQLHVRPLNVLPCNALPGHTNWHDSELLAGAYAPSLKVKFPVEAHSRIDESAWILLLFPATIFARRHRARPITAVSTLEL